MIPLRRFPEPEHFESDIHRKGLKWLSEQGIALDRPAPQKTKFLDCWTRCLDYLYDIYQGQCAYTGLYISRATGTPTVEHIHPKRLFPGEAYSWDNYCLACLRINNRKGEKLTIINPFEVTAGLFHLVLATGHIYANPVHPRFADAKRTINELRLDDGLWKSERRKCFEDYCNDIVNGLSPEGASQRLRRASAFVWTEVKNQGKLH